MSIHSEKSLMTVTAIACWITILRDTPNLQNQFFFSPCQVKQMVNSGSIIHDAELITYQKELPTVYYLPINDRGNHWILMEIEVEDRCISVYDPLEHDDKRHLKSAKKFGKAIDKALEVPDAGTRLLLSNVPIRINCHLLSVTRNKYKVDDMMEYHNFQKLGDTCGVWICAFLFFHRIGTIGRLGTFSEADVNPFRTFMLANIGLYSLCFANKIFFTIFDYDFISRVELMGKEDGGEEIAGVGVE